MKTWKRGVSLCCALATAGGAYAQPSNDDCTGAIAISHATLPFLSESVDISSAVSLGEFGGCAPIGFTVWYKITPAVSGSLYVSSCGGNAPAVTVVDTVVMVYASDDGTCDSLTSIGCNDDSCDYRSEVTFDTVAGTTYYIQVGQYGEGIPAPGEEHLQLYVSLPVPPPADRWIERGDALDSIAGAQDVSAPGRTALGSIAGELEAEGIDMFEIEICDPAEFSATTRGGTPFDTQLFLFNAAGFGVTYNDDSGETLQSTITGQFVPAAGRYFLAVGQYNNDPHGSSGGLLWNNDPYDVERAPDGPAGLSILDYWDGNGGLGGRYLVRLTGAAFFDGCVGGPTCPACAADFNEDGGVDGGDVESFFVMWESGGTCGDVNQDGGVDGGDVEAFFTVWESGGC